MRRGEMINGTSNHHVRLALAALASAAVLLLFLDLNLDPGGIAVSGGIEQRSLPFLDYDQFGGAPSRAARDLLTMPRPLRMLTLGGSVTAGSRVEEDETYASIVERSFGYEVHNLAIPATGSDYSAECIESMIRSGGIEEDIVFDIVTVEFSINGIAGLDVLLRRLRLRYPDAVIVYVDLYRIKKFQDGQYRDENLRCMKRVLEAGGGADPKSFSRCADPVVSQSVEEVGGIMYQLPPIFHEDVHGSMAWFDEDSTHLSKAGHFNVASGIVAVVENEWPSIPDVPRLGSWHGGDQCHSFFRGQLPEDVELVEGQLTNFNQRTGKFAIEVRMGETARVLFNVDSDETRITVAHMITGKPSLYPKVLVSLRNQDDQPKDMAFSSFKPAEREFYHIQRWMPLQNVARRGTNVLSITSLEETELPFRLTGIMMCSVCQSIDKIWNQREIILSADAASAQRWRKIQ